MSISSRIKHIQNILNISDKRLSMILNLSPGRVSQKFKADVWDSLEELKMIAKSTGYELDWIVTGQGKDLDLGDPTPMDVLEREAQEQQDLEDYEAKRNGYVRVDSLEELGYVQEDKASYMAGKKIRTVAVTVDKSGKELITYVPVRAQAGYTNGFADGEFLEKLPAFSLPILKEGSYRMFEVNGDSMLQLGGGGLHDGDIVIAQYVEDFYSIRDNRVYVIVSTEGVVVKRVLNRLTEKHNMVLVCNSDNKNGNYPAIILRPHQLLEVWELKAFISKQLSFSTDLWNMINDLQVQQALMQEKLNDMGR
jgi:phage repressor protein C with HTH and peptisase S24 domain